MTPLSIQMSAKEGRSLLLELGKCMSVPRRP